MLLRLKIPCTERMEYKGEVILFHFKETVALNLMVIPLSERSYFRIKMWF